MERRIKQQENNMIKNWIYYQLAMFYIRKAHKVDGANLDLWHDYMSKSRKWIAKIKP